MKRIKNTACFFLLCTLICTLILSACSPGGSDLTESTSEIQNGENTSGDVTSAETAETTSVDYSLKTDAVIVNGGNVMYTVVCPESAGDEGEMAANIIANTIESLCGKAPARTSAAGGDEAEEIIIGMYAFEPAKELYDKITYGTYLLQRYGNKILVAAADTEAYTSVKNYLKNLLTKNYADGTLTLQPIMLSNGKTGNVTGYVPVYRSTSKRPAYYLQCGSQKAENSAMQVVFETRKQTDFDSYCSQLQQDGYVKISENKFGYCNYATYGNDKYLINVSFYKSGGIMRIVSEKSYSVSLWDKSGTAGTQKVLMMQAYQDNVTYKGSHPGAYAIRLSDGRFILFDTGYAETATQLMEYMRSRNTFTDGKVHIALIIISHPHTDHMDGISALADKYSSEIICEAVGYNFTNVTRQSVYTESTMTGRQNTVISAAEKLGAECYCLRAGEKFDFSGTTLEVLFTADELGDYFLSGKNANGETDTNYDQNNSSLIVRLTVEGQTVTLTGDCRGGEAGIFNKLVLDSFQSDIMTVAHHGFNVSATLSMYTQAKPSVLFWPVRTDEQDMTRYFDKQLMAATYVKKHIFEDSLAEIELPYNP